jgi:preprotein translocase subunit SecG
VSTLILIIHIVICLVLIIAVLLQSGKSADLAGAFGGVGSQTAFGPRGTATLLAKITTVCAVLFMFTSIGLWILSLRGQKSVVRGEVPAKEVPAATEMKKETPPPATEKKEGAEQPKQPETPKKETGQEKKSD